LRYLCGKAGRLHEFAISASIVSIVLEHAEAAGASKVTKIALKIGRLSGIVPECVELQVSMLSRGTIAEGANLSFDQPPSSLHCRPCNIDYSPDDFNLLCPSCGKKEFDVVSGRECLVENIEVQ
jgi:hydrogenase nickel incorporation protein HypA/HybF